MLERITGQPFNVKKQKRSELEKERSLNLIKVESAEHFEKDQYVLTIEFESGPEDIIINPIAPAQLTLINSSIFAKNAGVSAEILRVKGIDLETEKGEAYFDEHSDAFQQQLREDIPTRDKFEYDRILAVALYAIDSPDWITEEVLKSWDQAVVEAIFNTATEGITGQDVVNAFPSDDTESEEAPGDVPLISDM